MVFVICEGQTKHSLVSVHLSFQVTQKRVFHKLLKKISNMGKSYDHWICMLISLLSSVPMFVCSFVSKIHFIDIAQDNLPTSTFKLMTIT